MATGQGGSDGATAGNVDTSNIITKLSQIGNFTITSQNQMTDLAASIKVITETVSDIKRNIASLKNSRSADYSESEKWQVKRIKAGRSHSYDISSNEKESGDEIYMFMTRSQAKIPDCLSLGRYCRLL